MTLNQQPLILLVDDEDYFREIFTKRLSAEGFRVETAKSGEEGVKKAKELKPDMILMDVKMPGMDGVAAMMAIKADPRAKDTKILFLTSAGEMFGGSHDHKADIRAAEEMGAVGYVMKTDDLANLAEKIRSFL